MAVVIVLVVTTVGTTVFVVIRTWLKDRPSRWTSAYDRLLDRNPTLNADRSLRWSVRARRARTGRLTALVVAVALLVATARPVAPVGATDDS